MLLQDWLCIKFFLGKLGFSISEVAEIMMGSICEFASTNADLKYLRIVDIVIFDEKQHKEFYSAVFGGISNSVFLHQCEFQLKMSKFCQMKLHLNTHSNIKVIRHIFVQVIFDL